MSPQSTAGYPANGRQAQALAQLVSNIPNKGGVRYYGYYSNKLRGLRKKAGTDDAVPALIESEVLSKEFRKTWARLIQKIYKVNPLLYPKCSGSMRIIAFIEEKKLVKKILKHLGLWDVKRKPPSRANSPPTESFIIYDESSSPSADDYLMDADRSTLSFDPEALEGRLSKGGSRQIIRLKPTFKKIQPQPNG